MEIRLTGLSGLSASRSTTRKEKKDKTHFSKSMKDVEKNISALQQSQSIFSVDPLFANLEDERHQKHAIEQGNRILDTLENLRQNLILGRIDPSHLTEIQHRIENLRHQDLPDHLKDILLEIETRARVEIAKHRKL